MRIARSQLAFAFITGLLLVICIFACNSNSKTSDTIADTPAEMQQKAADLIKEYLVKASADSGRSVDSSVLFHHSRLSRMTYEKKSYTPIWSKEEKWLPNGDSMFQFIEKSKLFGLFPEDYHFEQLKNIQDRFLLTAFQKETERMH